MSDTVQKLRVLSRVEIALLRIHLRTFARQVVLCSAGLLLVLLAVGMTNVSIYLFLAERLESDVAALIVAAINAVLAVGLFLIATRSRPGPETAMVEEIRDLAVAEIRSDVDAVRQNINDVTVDVQRIRSGFSQMVRGGGSLRGLLGLGPLLEVLTSSLKRSKGK